MRAEIARLKLELEKAEEERKAQTAEEERKAEEARKAEEERKAEENRKAEEARKAQLSPLDTFKEMLKTTGAGAFVRQVGQSGPTLIIVVSEDWRYAAYQARLEAAYQLWKCWATIRSPDDMNAAFLMILDEYGNNVGGSGWSRGSQISVKKD